MHITPSPRPYTRTVFERRFNVLRELIEKGKMTFSVNSESSVDSLTAIRIAPNKRYNLSTINEMARATAMSVDSFGSRLGALPEPTEQ